MIKIALIDNLFCPIVTCDSCLGRIGDFAWGNVSYRMSDPAIGRRTDPWLPVKDGELFFTHKRCTDAFEHAHRARWSWLPLGEFLLQLGFHTQMWTDTEAGALEKRLHDHAIKLPDDPER